MPKGPQGERGNMLFIKVIKSRKWKKQFQKYNIIQMLKSTLFSHIFKNVPFKMYKNIYNTPQIFSGMLKIAPKALQFLKFLGGVTPPLLTFPAASHPVYYSANKILATFIFSLLVYRPISQMYLLVQLCNFSCLLFVYWIYKYC